MAEFTPNFNFKKPDETDFFNIEDFNGNMDILDEKLKEASQNEQLQGDVTEIKGTTEEIKTSVGSSGDLSSSPTLFGRLAEIKETLTSKFSDVVSRITGIDGKIGTTTDTGGTSSAGSIFAKINKLLTDWTSTRAGRIDSIYTNTNTSTTSSSTGTLSQKLNYIKGLIGTSGDSGTNTVLGLLSGISSKGTVKSVQRGVVNTQNKTTININSINPSKSIVLLDNQYIGYAYGESGTSFGSERYFVKGSYIASVTANSITITENYVDSGTYGNVSWQVIEFY